MSHSVGTADSPSSGPITQYVSPTKGNVSQLRVIVSEWIKLRSLKSSWITLAVAIVLTVLLGFLFSFLTNKQWDNTPAARRLDFDPSGTSLAGTNFAQLAIGVLGILFVSGEYSTGMIRSTLGAVPKRLPVIWAKVVVFGLVTLVTMEISSFAAFFVGQAALGTHSTTISAHGVFRVVAGSGINLALTAIFAMGIGFMIRSTGGGMAAYFGVMLVLPIVLNFLPQSWQDHTGPYLPAGAGRAFLTANPAPGDLAPWAGFGIYCAWAVASLIGAAYLLKTRDA